MALLPIIVKVPFPDIPQLPGVPQIPRSPLSPTLDDVTLGADVPQDQLWQSTTTAPMWGIFDSDLNQVVFPDSVADFDNRNEYRISSFPVQKGGFASYNKVRIPFETSVRLIKGGTQAEREAFLQTLDDTIQSNDLFIVLTPERSYQDVNCIRYEISRHGAGGAYFLTEVQLFFVEIQTVTPEYGNSTAAATQNAQDPDAQPVVNQGSVQAVRKTHPRGAVHSFDDNFGVIGDSF